jgi:hypothetical protein
MKYVFTLLVILGAYVITFSQQNFFNVPSSDITPKNRLFVQQQVNIDKINTVANTTLNYGLGDDFEIGFNLLNVTFPKGELTIEKNTYAAPFYPFACLNAQKKLSLSNSWSIATGCQMGLSFGTTKHTGSYFYCNSIYKTMYYKIVSGLYNASRSFFGPGKTMLGQSLIGMQLGTEIKLYRDKLFFQADFFSGQHNLGALIIGGSFNVTNQLIISSGYQIPNVHGSAFKAFVLEITYNPKS